MGFVLALLGFLVAGARAEESPLKASDLHLLKTDLPPGWVPLNKPVDTEEAKQIREAFETIKQKAAGLSLSMQGIDASGQHLNLVFIGFPDEKTVKDLGAFITLLFGKRFPRRYGTVYALVMSENEKLAAYLHEKIARRFAFVRINRIDAMIKSGRNPEAAEALQKLVPTLPPVSLPVPPPPSQAQRRAEGVSKSDRTPRKGYVGPHPSRQHVVRNRKSTRRIGRRKEGRGKPRQGRRSRP
jgi:hypothetical protein